MKKYRIVFVSNPQGLQIWVSEFGQSILNLGKYVSKDGSLTNDERKAFITQAANIASAICDGWNYDESFGVYKVEEVK